MCILFHTAICGLGLGLGLGTAGLDYKSAISLLLIHEHSHATTGRILTVSTVNGKVLVVRIQFLYWTP